LVGSARKKANEKIPKPIVGNPMSFSVYRKLTEESSSLIAYPKPYAGRTAITLNGSQ